MSPALRALMDAISGGLRRREVVFCQRAGPGCTKHAWRAEAGTARHDYEECVECGARRIMDRHPLEQPVETVDLDWACREGETTVSSRALPSVPPILSLRAHPRG